MLHDGVGDKNLKKILTFLTLHVNLREKSYILRFAKGKSWDEEQDVKLSEWSSLKVKRRRKKPLFVPQWGNCIALLQQLRTEEQQWSKNAKNEQTYLKIRYSKY